MVFWDIDYGYIFSVRYLGNLFVVERRNDLIFLGIKWFLNYFSFLE